MAQSRGVFLFGEMILFLSIFILAAPAAFPQAVIIDHTCTDLSLVPSYWLEQAKQLTFHYAHTSHGSQVVSGIENLESLDSYYSVAVRQSSSEGLPPAEDPPALRIYDGTPPETYISPDDYWEGSSAWARTTAVAATGSYNFSMWSWCGQVSDASESYINQYLSALDQFESWYPSMRFIYMTGHLDGTGEAGNLHIRNNRIRSYCINNDKILFDFADIESYDPSGNYFLDLDADDNCDYSGGNWAQEWCQNNPGSSLCESCSCAHSQPLNCNQKGRAFWWMMARLAGWNGQTAAASPTPPLPTPTPTFCCVTPSPFFNQISSGDYDGDGSSDIAIFRSGSGLWGVRGITRAYFGSGDDRPVPGDYDGNGTSDIGIFRSSSGLWAIRGVTRVYFGSSEDTAVPFAYNPSSACRMGIFRASTGLWAIRGVTRSYFGSSGDRPVPGDYDGDTTGDLAIFRASSGLWAIQGVSRIYFGDAGDSVVPGDYDGSGTRATAIFRASSGLWSVRGVTRIYFGSAADCPVPADYNGDGASDIAVFRGTSGLWALKGITRVYYGSNGDLPVTR